MSDLRGETRGQLVPTPDCVSRKAAPMEIALGSLSQSVVRLEKEIEELVQKLSPLYQKEAMLGLNQPLAGQVEELFALIPSEIRSQARKIDVLSGAIAELRNVLEI